MKIQEQKRTYKFISGMAYCRDKLSDFDIELLLIECFTFVFFFSSLFLVSFNSFVSLLLFYSFSSSQRSNDESISAFCLLLSLSFSLSLTWLLCRCCSTPALLPFGHAYINSLWCCYYYKRFIRVWLAVPFRKIFPSFNDIYRFI